MLKTVFSVFFWWFNDIYKKLDFNINKRLNEIKNSLDKSNRKNKIKTIKQVIYNLPAWIRDTKIINYMPIAIWSYKILWILIKKWWWNSNIIDVIWKAPKWNVTTRMWLSIWDLADKIKENKDLKRYFTKSLNENFIEDLKSIKWWKEFLNSFNLFLNRYWVRCTWEIDITRPRWKNQPYQVALLILNNVLNQGINGHIKEFRKSEADSIKASEKLIKKIRKTKFGFFKSIIIKRLIYVYRQTIWVREHPKFFLINVFFLIRESILFEANVLKEKWLLEEDDDIFYFDFDEIDLIIKDGVVDKSLLEKRKQEFERNSSLKPPRIFDENGEILVAKSDIIAPEWAIVWTAASAWIIEWKARVIMSLKDAYLKKWEILVTSYTDPAWTTLFWIAGWVVTEVWWLLTHGAVVAREYGIPAVVWVDNATSKIKDWDRIRLNGSEWFIEIIN